MYIKQYVGGPNTDSPHRAVKWGGGVKARGREGQRERENPRIHPGVGEAFSGI